MTNVQSKLYAIEIVSNDLAAATAYLKATKQHFQGMTPEQMLQKLHKGDSFTRQEFLDRQQMWVDLAQATIDWLNTLS